VDTVCIDTSFTDHLRMAVHHGADKIIDSKVYPNPALSYDELIIEILASAKSYGEIKLFDQFGRIVFTKKETIEVGNNLFSIPIRTLASGVYFYSLNGTYIQKIIVIK